MLSRVPKATQLIRGELGFKPRQPGSKIDALNHAKRRRKTGSFHHCHQRTGDVTFRAVTQECRPLP